MTMPVFIGLDPGVSGGMAAIRCKPRTIEINSIEMTKMPSTNKDILLWILERTSTNSFVALEKVGGFMGTRTEEGQHRNKAAAHNMFTFGSSYGKLEMALEACSMDEGDQWCSVRPQEWQKATGCPTRNKGEKREKYKARLKDYAVELFPHTKKPITLSTCDALLIAYWCLLNAKTFSSRVKRKINRVNKRKGVV
jgi:hypothetical protein